VMIRWLLRVASADRIVALVLVLGALAILGGVLGVLFGGSLNLSS